MSRKFTYVAPPTGKRFHDVGAGTYLYKGIRGVPGSGKSVVCCWDIRLLSEMQPEIEDPATGQMVRWSRWGLFRKTFPALKDTTIKTWTSWFPVGSLTELHESPPIEGVFEAPSLRNDGTLVRIELKCYATDAPNFVDALDSLELSGAWINEAAQVEWEKVHKVQERVGRFKPPGGAASGMRFRSFGVIMDTNTPLESSWWHEMEFEQVPERMMWFVQPPALVEVRRGDGSVSLVPNTDDAGLLSRYGVTAERLSEAREAQLKETAHECSRVYVSHGPAENVEHHDEGWDYYLKELIGAKPDYVRTRLLNKYGRSKGGLPVYEETWNDSFHVSVDDMGWMRGLPLIVGMDFARNPAAVFGQLTAMGQGRIYAELAKSNMSVPHYFENYFMPFLVNEYGWPDCRVLVFGDPAGENPGEMSEYGPIEYLNAHGIPAMVPPCLVGRNNDLALRIESVEQMLNRSRGGVPDLLVSKRCRMLRDGFNGDYHYRKVGNSARYQDKPEKNEYSHPHDALQYWCCGVRTPIDSRVFLPASEAFGGVSAESLRMRCGAV